MGRTRDPTNLRYGDMRPVSDSDKKFMENWANDKLEQLLTYSRYAPGFSEHICKRIIQSFGQDDKLSGLLQKHLHAERQGKDRGRKAKWDRPRLLHALTYHNIRLNEGDNRKRVLSNIAEMNGLTGKNASNRISKRIREAQELVDSGTVPEALCPPILKIKGD